MRHTNYEIVANVDELSPLYLDEIFITGSLKIVQQLFVLTILLK